MFVYFFHLGHKVGRGQGWGRDKVCAWTDGEFVVFAENLRGKPVESDMIAQNNAEFGGIDVGLGEKSEDGKKHVIDSVG